MIAFNGDVPLWLTILKTITIKIKIHMCFLCEYLGFKKEFAIYVIKIKDIILEIIIIVFTKYHEDNLHIYFQILFYNI